MPVTLLCAGALRPTPASDPQAPPGPGASPAFLRLLGCSDPGKVVGAARAAGQPLTLESGEEAWLRGRFSVADDASVAAVAGLEHGAAAGSLILRPIHLHAGIDHLVLDPPAALELEEADSLALFDSARDWLSAEPIRLRYLASGVWELSESDPVRTRFDQLRAASVARASGRNIDAWLPGGPPARNWRRLMNEVQMLWHSHPANGVREAVGKKTVNALWLEGRVPSQAGRAFEVLIGNDPVLRGLARLCGAQIEPANARSGSLSIDDPSRVLIDAPFWREPSPDGSEDHWQAGWRAFEPWFKTLQAGLSLGRGREFELVLTGECSARAFHFPRRAGWRVWRRPASLSLLDDMTFDQ